MHESDPKIRRLAVGAAGGPPADGAAGGQVLSAVLTVLLTATAFAGDNDFRCWTVDARQWTNQGYQSEKDGVWYLFLPQDESPADTVLSFSGRVTAASAGALDRDSGTLTGAFADRDRVTLTYTYLDTPDGLRIAAPNSSLSAGKITNYTTLGTRRIQHSVSASYDAPVQTVRQALLDAVARTPGLLESPGPEVYVNAYGESGIEYIVRSWARTADYWTAYYALLENIKAAFDERAVEMPYNHLNVHIVDPVRVERETKA